VKDFIESPILWDTVILGKTPGFDPHLSLTKALVLEVIKWDRRTSSAEQLDGLIGEALVWASRVSRESRKRAIELLGVLELIVAGLRTKIENRAILPSLEMSPGPPWLLPLALQLNLDWWVSHLFAEGAVPNPPRTAKPYIFFTVDRSFFVDYPKAIGEEAFFRPSISCLRLLLAHGSSIYARHEEVPFPKFVRLELAEACRRQKNKHEWGRRSKGVGRDTSTKSILQRIEYWLLAAEFLVKNGADNSLLAAVLPNGLRQHAFSEEEGNWSPEIDARICKLVQRQNASSSIGLSPRQRALQMVSLRRQRKIDWRDSVQRDETETGAKSA
jgi:hypothetical protein